MLFRIGLLVSLCSMSAGPSGTTHDPGCSCQECTDANEAGFRSDIGPTPSEMTRVSKPVPAPERTLLEEEHALQRLGDHVASEAGFVAAYRELADAPTTPEAARYLIRLVLEDEERHHRVLQELLTAIANRVAARDDPDAVPDLPHEPPDRALQEVTSQFLAAERADAKQLRALRKELRSFRDTSLWALLIELMEHDTAKHIHVLTFIRDRVAGQPRRYLPISRALDAKLELEP